MTKPEQDQIDAEFEKARWVSLKLPAMITAEEVRFGRKVWRLGYLAGAAAERAAALQIVAEVDAELATGWHVACQKIEYRIRQRGEGKADEQID